MSDDASAFAGQARCFSRDLCRMPNGSYIHRLHVSAITVDHVYGGNTLLHALSLSPEVTKPSNRYAVYAAFSAGSARLQLTESYQDRALAQQACEWIIDRHF